MAPSFPGRVLIVVERSRPSVALVAAIWKVLTSMLSGGAWATVVDEKCLCED